MRHISTSTFVFLALLLTACQAATHLPPVTAATDTEFTLVPDQTAAIKNTGLSIGLVGVSSDRRCPSVMECARTGPVTLTISIQDNSNPPAEFIMEIFTDMNGRAPESPVEGIQDPVEYEGYVIRIRSVLPYPGKSFNDAKDAKYRVSFLVTAQ